MFSRTETLVGATPELQKRAIARATWLKSDGLAKIAYSTFEPETQTVSVYAVFATKQRLEASEAKAPQVNCGVLEGSTIRLAALLHDL